ncbi:MAG TPA: formate dehydrogenase accessory sulfurtransferase FdhD [Saprospiraceae bacterium]|nr:formate dehydrogenase accessory sulfurtransferase FdhD [Saprospiraceae bacterium]
MHPLSVSTTTVRTHEGGRVIERTDLLAVEEPLEMRVVYGPASTVRALSVTMRTPGHDEDLVAGFLLTEGIGRQRADLLSLQAQGPNVMLAHLRPDLAFSPDQLERHFYTTSSCGVCGKTSIEALQVASGCSWAHAGPPDWQPAPEVLYGLPATLRQAQSTFEATGGLHAAALFDEAGQLLCLREDVGRHNALDKLIGHYCLQEGLPLRQHILLLSGRASFELMQKAAMAGLRHVCAVGAPSSLAVQTAATFGIRLSGFLRDGRFNVYGQS